MEQYREGNTTLGLEMSQSPYGDFGTPTLSSSYSCIYNVSEFQSPYGDFGTPTIKMEKEEKGIVVSVPLRGFWYADHLI